MKLLKIALLSLTALLVVGAVGCGESTTSSSNNNENKQKIIKIHNPPTEEELNTVIEIEDKYLDLMIRYELFGAENESEFLSQITIRDMHNIEYLDLLNVNEKLDTLLENDIISEYDIKKYGIKDYSCLSYCTDMRKLFIDSTYITDIDFVKNMKKIDTITIVGRSAYDYYSKWSNRELNVSELKSLTKLSNLVIYDNSVKKLPQLNKDIEIIHIYSNSINDISTLKSIRNLNILSISGENIYDLSVLQKAENIHELHVSNCEPYPMRIICPSDYYCEIYECPSWWNADDIQINTDIFYNNKVYIGLDKLPTSICELTITGMGLYNIDFVKRLTNLRNLNISSTNVCDLTPLLELEKFNHLTAVRCQSADFSVLDENMLTH